MFSKNLRIVGWVDEAGVVPIPPTREMIEEDEACWRMRQLLGLSPDDEVFILVERKIKDGPDQD